MAEQAHLKDSAVFTYLEEFAAFIPRLECDDMIKFSPEAVNIVKIIADLQKESQNLEEISEVLEGKAGTAFENEETAALTYIQLGHSLVTLVNRQTEALGQMVELIYVLARLLSGASTVIKNLTTSEQERKSQRVV